MCGRIAPSFRIANRAVLLTRRDTAENRRVLWSTGAGVERRPLRVALPPRPWFSSLSDNRHPPAADGTCFRDAASCQKTLAAHGGWKACPRLRTGLARGTPGVPRCTLAKVPPARLSLARLLKSAAESAMRSDGLKISVYCMFQGCGRMSRRHYRDDLGSNRIFGAGVRFISARSRPRGWTH